MSSIDVALANAKKQIDVNVLTAKAIPTTAIRHNHRTSDEHERRTLEKPLPEKPTVEKDLPWQGHPLDSAIRPGTNVSLPQGDDEWSRWHVAEKIDRRRAVDLTLSDQIRVLELALQYAHQLQNQLRAEHGKQQYE